MRKEITFKLSKLDDYSFRAIDEISRLASNQNKRFILHFERSSKIRRKPSKRLQITTVNGLRSNAYLVLEERTQQAEMDVYNFNVAMSTNVEIEIKIIPRSRLLTIVFIPQDEESAHHLRNIWK